MSAASTDNKFEENIYRPSTPTNQPIKVDLKKITLAPERKKSDHTKDVKYEIEKCFNKLNLGGSGDD